MLLAAVVALTAAAVVIGGGVWWARRAEPPMVRPKYRRLTYEPADNQIAVAALSQRTPNRSRHPRELPHASQRAQELVLYDFLRRVHQSRKARQPKGSDEIID